MATKILLFSRQSFKRCSLIRCMSSDPRDPKDLDPKWAEMAKKQLKGKDPNSLRTMTNEGIEIKPLYTAHDLYNDADKIPENLDTSLPGNDIFSIFRLRAAVGSLISL